MSDPTRGAPTPPLGERSLARAARAIRVRRFAGTLSHAERLGRVIRIAHLTDVHVGRITPPVVHRTAVALTNAQRPDLVVITGDFVGYGTAYLDRLEEMIAGFDAPVFAVLGNHDHWSGPAEVRQALRRSGAEILDNASTVIEVGSERLQVVGLDDAYTGHADLRRAVRGLRRDLATVGLSHIAEEADALWRHGVPLVLAGHTHGGQVTVARLNELALGRLAGHRYVHGLYGRRAETLPHPALSRPPGAGALDAGAHGAVYVGAGIGTTLVPVRWGERGKREIAIFDLGASPGSFPEEHTEQTPLPGRATSMRRLERRQRLAERGEVRRRWRRVG